MFLLLLPLCIAANLANDPSQPLTNSSYFNQTSPDDNFEPLTIEIIPNFDFNLSGDFDRAEGRFSNTSWANYITLDDEQSLELDVWYYQHSAARMDQSVPEHATDSWTECIDYLWSCFLSLLAFSGLLLSILWLLKNFRGFRSVLPLSAHAFSFLPAHPKVRENFSYYTHATICTW